MLDNDYALLDDEDFVLDEEEEFEYSFDEQLVVETQSNPIRLGDNYTEVGEFNINLANLKNFYDNAVHLDRKDSETYLTLTVMNNFCFVYSLNIGIVLTALFSCDYPSNIPLVVSLPINKILKLLNTEEKAKFIVEEDEIILEKSNMRVSIMKPNLIYLKDSAKAIDDTYTYYNTPTHDNFENQTLVEMLSTMNTYAKFNQADKRVIILDGKVAYVKSVGYYVHQTFISNRTYLINPTLANMLIKMCKLQDLEHYEVKILVEEDVYVIMANNYVLTFPILDGKGKFSLLGKIQPTTVYAIDKKELRTALNQLDLYSEKKCALTLGETVSIQNKTIQGTAYITLGYEKLEDARDEQENVTYIFDYNKFSRVLTPLKSDKIMIMECNTQEHLYITDEKMTFYIILSIK